MLKINKYIHNKQCTNIQFICCSEQGGSEGGYKGSPPPTFMKLRWRRMWGVGEKEGGRRKREKKIKPLLY
jgi:hypothetical protein